ncbi:uncharacterized protein LOC126368644 [Pectinophora gossypiella]|uniref:uncharacterized protein LOC126368644 n=1 Tax=Pectinophora gossypiella TaxID=13191 RepID=UPI00214F4495|nr:uncharacterized protein LOC126368644 [Pectinophora gossypiella]
MADVVTDDKYERDFTSTLIELYRKHPVLWKVNHPLYSSRYQRSRAFKKIATALRPYKPKITEDYLKKKINVLRSNYNNVRRKIVIAERQGTNKCIKRAPWYYNELLFLAERGKKQRSSRKRRIIFAVEDDGSQEVEYYPDQPENDILPDTAPEESFEPTPASPHKLDDQKTITVERETIEIPEKEVDSEPEKYMTITTTYYRKPKSKEDYMTKAWAMKLNKLPALQRLHAERIINEVFYEAEMGNLSKDTQIGVVLP